MKIKLTNDEISVLRIVDDNYSWIARDTNGELYVFLLEPIRNERFNWDSHAKYANLRIFSHRFKSITGKECFKISDLLEVE